MYRRSRSAWIVALSCLIVAVGIEPAAAALLGPGQKDGPVGGLIDEVEDTWQQVQDNACSGNCGAVSGIVNSTLNGASGAGNAIDSIIQPGGSSPPVTPPVVTPPVVDPPPGTNPGPSSGPNSAVGTGRSNNQSNSRQANRGNASRSDDSAFVGKIKRKKGRGIVLTNAPETVVTEDDGFGISLGIAGLRLNGSGIAGVAGFLLLGYGLWRHVRRKPPEEDPEEAKTLARALSVGSLGSTGR